MRIVTLTTDFGLQDWFVGAMKGVIAGRAPGCQIIDITHGVAPGDIWGGAFALAAAAPFFPAGTVHLAVVDPGVGSSRHAIVAKTESACFVGPDNGVLSLALRGMKILEVHRIKDSRLWLGEVSRTFHGRDVFAPVAALIAEGLRLDKVGPRVDYFIRLHWSEPSVTPTGWRGQVIYLDRFGNGITNLPSVAIQSRRKVAHHLKIGRTRLMLGTCYADAKLGEALAVQGSVGLLEVAVNGGSAAKELKLRRGTPVELLCLPD